MGLEILDEFRPVKPIRTGPAARTFGHRAEVLSDPETTKEINNEEQDQECHTPTSPTQTLRAPLICPPPPKKPRVARRANLIAPSQGFFQVPHDLASVFVLQAKPSTFPRRAEEALC